MMPGFVHLRLLPLRDLLKNRLRPTDGQDLIEYALMVALIAFGATAAMSTVAVSISKIFITLGDKITSNIT